MPSRVRGRMDIATYGVGIFLPSILAALATSGSGSFLAREIASIEGAAFCDLFLVVGLPWPSC